MPFIKGWIPISYLLCLQSPEVVALVAFGQIEENEQVARLPV